MWRGRREGAQWRKDVGGGIEEERKTKGEVEVEEGGWSSGGDIKKMNS